MYLQIKELNKSYGSKKVVSDVDLVMEEGEILSLLGPSGCGKTTILRMIAGLVTPDSGWIQIGEKVLFNGKREVPVEVRELGMVFQDFALWPHMTVERNIAFGMSLRGYTKQKIKQKVQELLELVNLPGMERRYPYQLSGGQQQRIALARALATEPRVILLDEPLSSLDAALRESMRAELVQIFKALKITAINVTHDQDEAMSMSDRIMVLRDGKVQQVGSPMELYLSPANVFVASFLGAANLLSGVVMDIPSDTEMATIRLQHALFAEKVAKGKLREEIRSQLNGQVSLLCRPDHVQVHREERQFEHPNIFVGTVTYSSFVGGRWRTLVKLGDELEPVLALPSFQPQLNQQLWVEFPPEHSLIIPG